MAHFGSIQQKFWMQCVLDPTMIRIGSARCQFGGGFWYAVSGVKVGTLQDRPKRLLFFWSGDDGSNGEKTQHINNHQHIILSVYFLIICSPELKTLNWIMPPKKNQRQYCTTSDETFDGRAFQMAAGVNFVASFTCCVSTWDLVNVFFGEKVGIKRRVSTRMSMANAMSKKSQQKDTADTADSWTNCFERTGVH